VLFVRKKKKNKESGGGRESQSGKRWCVYVIGRSRGTRDDERGTLRGARNKFVFFEMTRNFGFSVCRFSVVLYQAQLRDDAHSTVGLKNAIVVLFYILFSFKQTHTHTHTYINSRVEKEKEREPKGRRNTLERILFLFLFCTNFFVVHLGHRILVNSRVFICSSSFLMKFYFF
jgi:hypothetical protein